MSASRPTAPLKSSASTHHRTCRRRGSPGPHHQRLGWRRLRPHANAGVARRTPRHSSHVDRAAARSIVPGSRSSRHRRRRRLPRKRGISTHDNGTTAGTRAVGAPRSQPHTPTFLPPCFRRPLATATHKARASVPGSHALGATRGGLKSGRYPKWPSVVCRCSVEAA